MMKSLSTLSVVGALVCATVAHADSSSLFNSSWGPSGLNRFLEKSSAVAQTIDFGFSQSGAGFGKFGFPAAKSAGSDLPNPVLVAWPMKPGFGQHLGGVQQAAKPSLITLGQTAPGLGVSLANGINAVDGSRCPPVPEPASVLGMLVAGGLAYARRFRSRKA